MRNGLCKVFCFLAMATAFPFAASACEACVSNPDDPQTQGMQAAILTLLIITYGLLMTIVGFFFYLRLKQRKPMLEVIQHARSI